MTSQPVRASSDGFPGSGALPCVCRAVHAETTCDSTIPAGKYVNRIGVERDSDIYTTAIHVLILMLDRTAPRSLSPPEEAVATESD